MIEQNMIFIPLLAQVFLTMLVWLWMYKTRIEEMKKNKISPQKIAKSVDSSAFLKSVAEPSDNFKNLFEVPVLFYVAVIVIYITHMADHIFFILAVAFVSLRYIHSFIHITYNRVMHRFFAYMLSTLIIWAMWLMIGLKLF